jgi:hypothetical protein
MPATLEQASRAADYIALYDSKSETGITVIDLDAGHANAGETLTGRVITTLKSRALLNESPGAGQS